ATILEVPTSRPIGLVPVFTRSSIRSWASSATFQRCSLVSAIALSSDSVGAGCPALPARPRRGARVGGSGGPLCIRCLLILRLIGQPRVEPLLPLLPHLLHRRPSRGGLVGQ